VATTLIVVEFAPFKELELAVNVKGVAVET
jgi:hypothetical protein